MLELQYDGASFDAETIARLAANLQALIKSALREPSASIGSLEMLSAEERRLLIEELNQTMSAGLPARFVHQEFERQAASAASEVAAVYRGKAFSYGELNERANQLAHYLQARGVGPDVLVGVCLERSFEMLVAVLGILKAGGAYLPLDSSYPKERLAFIIDDARVSLLITARQQSAMLPQTVRSLLIDAERKLIGAYDSANPRSETEPENLAYVIYTSGSTGQPKGVMIPHGGLSNYLGWCAQSYGVAEGQGSPVHSPLTFDLTLTSIFPALLAGKKLLLLDEEEAAGEALARALREHEDFSLVKLTPAHLEWLAHSLKPEEASGSTRALIIGGEALYAESLRFWRTHSPSTRIINEYGPTEAVVGCCVYEVPPEEQASGAVPIGRAIANTQLYILDEELRPSPLMVAGEIYIGGAGLARGYLNRLELTAEKFIPDPFSRQAGRRLYRTGDRGRVRADGIIEYLGRTDYQLKIKGYRIEPGEIEAVLCGHEGVREAVVIARGEKEEKQLVGYVLARGGVELNESELREYLREHLPQYMIPTFLVALDKMPLTPNGKVDREALPQPGQRTRSEGREPAAPRNHTEEILAAIWAEILGVERVGIHDNFFELGGDSIRGIQAIARANRAGIKLAAQQLFEQQTIAGLARVAGSAPVVRTEQHLLTGPVELTPIQRWFFARNLDAPQDFNQSILLEARRPLDLSLLEESARLLLAHHDSLRLRFHQTPAGWTQSYASSADDAPPVSQVLVSAATEAEYAAAIEMAVAEWPPFDLSVGPLLRFTLFRSTKGLPDRLHIVTHHLAVDGVSWRILLEDLELCIAQLAEGESVRLPPKTTSYQ
ncbi:MAG TPA: amino acid adenylation domain-containing protein, partial [Pyrinomonadaceae bacterium]